MFTHLLTLAFLNWEFLTEKSNVRGFALAELFQECAMLHTVIEQMFHTGRAGQ